MSNINILIDQTGSFFYHREKFLGFGAVRAFFFVTGRGAPSLLGGVGGWVWGVEGEVVCLYRVSGELAHL